MLWSGDQNGGAAIFREQQFLFCFYDGGKTDQDYSCGNHNELIMMCSSIKHKEAERDDADGRQIEKVTNGNLNRYHLTTRFRTTSDND